tara:strand:+ start:674 stop:991 length:318 start_codon:yes stop_codon:yes gene_type:complete
MGRNTQPGSIGNGVASEPSLKIFVNSSRAETFLRVMRANGSATIKCERFSEGRRTGYDAVCETPIQTEDYQAKQLHLKIYRRKYDRSLDPETLVVRLPSPVDQSS